MIKNNFNYTCSNCNDTYRCDDPNPNDKWTFYCQPCVDELKEIYQRKINNA